MKKISVSATNDICPQTLFVYGSMNEDDTPDFGLFCWFSYCWFDQLGVICAIGGSKRTLENIRRNKVFFCQSCGRRQFTFSGLFWNCRWQR